MEMMETFMNIKSRCQN